MKVSVPNDAIHIINEVEQSLASDANITNQTSQETVKSNGHQNNTAIFSKIKQLYSKALKMTHADLHDKLSGREIEILQLICAGRTTNDIATSLNLSSHTVESHRANIFSKMDVRNVAELVALAFRVGLVE